MSIIDQSGDWELENDHNGRLKPLSNIINRFINFNIDHIVNVSRSIKTVEIVWVFYLAVVF